MVLAMQASGHSGDFVSPILHLISLSWISSQLLEACCLLISSLIWEAAGVHTVHNYSLARSTMPGLMSTLRFIVRLGFLSNLAKWAELILTIGVCHGRNLNSGSHSCESNALSLSYIRTPEPWGMSDTNRMCVCALYRQQNRDDGGISLLNGNS